MKKKLLTLSIVQLVFVAFAIIMLFIPFTVHEKESDWNFMACTYLFDTETLLDILTDEPMLLPLPLYPVEVIITAIVLIFASVKTIKLATDKITTLPKKAHTNCILMLIIGILAWCFSIVIFLDENEVMGAFVYGPLVYLLPAIALMIVNGEIKNTFTLLKKEAAKQAKAQAETQTEAQTEAK